MSPTDTAPGPTLARLQVSLHGVSGLGFGGLFSSHWTEIWVQVSLFTIILKISTVVDSEFEHTFTRFSLWKALVTTALRWRVLWSNVYRKHQGSERVSSTGSPVPSTDESAPQSTGTTDP